ncbi:hypothetical protein WA158_006356 [Blastocystis sp. Blastoise]
MSATEFHLTEDKYLFTFQDETQLWVPRDFIEKYPQFSFHDIIEHSEKYDDGSYYVDMLPFHMKKVIDFFMKNNTDFTSLNLRDAFDIYMTLLEYSVTIGDNMQNDLIFYIKYLFYTYLKDNNYCIYGTYGDNSQSYMPIMLFSSDNTRISINRLFTLQRKKELFYYSYLLKMMNIAEIEIECIYLYLFNIFNNNNIDDYSSNIPLEYICPSNIKDIFPSLKELKITVTTNFKKTKILLNPNSDEYIVEYARLFYNSKFTNNNPEKYDIDKISTKDGISQLLRFPSYYSISQIEINTYVYSKYEAIICIQLLIENVFNSLTILSVKWIKKLTNKIDDNLFNKIIATHVFPNVTELIYDDESFQLSSIYTKCFPKLKTVNYIVKISIQNFDFLFPVNLMPIIKTIHIHEIEATQKKKLALKLYYIVYTFSIHIDGIDDLLHFFISLYTLFEKDLISIHKLYIDTSDSIYMSQLDYFKLYKHDINILDILFKNDRDYDDEKYQLDMRNSLEFFLKSNILQHLNCLTVTFDNSLSIDSLTWISTLFNDNKFNTIHELTINLNFILVDISSDIFALFETIMEKIILKASIVYVKYCHMTFINQLICKGCFYNTTKLTIITNDIPDNDFYNNYTINNFSQLKSIEFGNYWETEWWRDFIQKLLEYIHNDNFQLSNTIRLSDTIFSDNDYIFYPNTSIFRLKYQNCSLMDTLISTKNQTMNKYEIEILLDCIDQKKTKNLKRLKIYIYNEDQLSKLINSITNEKIPKLKELIFDICIHTLIYINNILYML